MDKTCDKVVLLIEDNSDDEYLAKYMLKKIGLTDILVARDGEEAISTLNFIKPDIVFLDLRMPKIDGLEILKYIEESERLSHANVIVLSSTCDPKDINTCKKYNVPIFSKPMSADIIKQTLGV